MLPFSKAVFLFSGTRIRSVRFVEPWRCSVGAWRSWPSRGEGPRGYMFILA